MESINSKNEEEKKVKPTLQSKALTEEQYKVISDQISKSLCQITTKKTKAIIFLCKIPNLVLITNFYFLNETQVKLEKEVKILSR